MRLILASILSQYIGTRKHARLTVFKEQKLWNVIRPQYIIDSVAKKDVLPLEPMYMYVTLDFKKQEFLKVMDEYGDYFTKLLKEDVTKTVSNLETHYGASYSSSLFFYIALGKYGK